MDKQIPHHKLNPQRNLNFGRERGKFQKEEKALDNFAAFSRVKKPSVQLGRAHYLGVAISQIKDSVPLPAASTTLLLPCTTQNECGARLVSSLAGE